MPASLSEIQEYPMLTKEHVDEANSERDPSKRFATRNHQFNQELRSIQREDSSEQESRTGGVAIGGQGADHD